MTERHDDGPAPDRKPAAKTTIVGGQPDAEPDLRTVPVGLETLLAMAAVDDAFARELLDDPVRARRASGVTLTPTEDQILLSVDRDALVHMIARVGDRIPDRSRRAFLKKSAAALLAIVGGAALSGCREKDDGGGVAVTGAVADVPRPPKDSPRRWLVLPVEAPGDASILFDNFPPLAGGPTKFPVAIYFHSGHSFGENPEEAAFENKFAGSPEVTRATRGYLRWRCQATELPAAVVARHGIVTPCLLFFHTSGRPALRIDATTEDLAAAAAELQSILRSADPGPGKALPKDPPSSDGR